MTTERGVDLGHAPARHRADLVVYAFGRDGAPCHPEYHPLFPGGHVEGWPKSPK